MGEQERSFLDATLPHLDLLYRIARNAGHDHHLAEDVVQETYLRAYAAFDQRRGDNTRAWMVSICLNLIRSEGRRRRRPSLRIKLRQIETIQARVLSPRRWSKAA